MIFLKSPEEIEKMSASGRVVAEILAEVRERIRPGVTTRELDQLADRLCAKKKAKAAFKGYRGYPFSLCVSVNEEVVHGMPNKTRILREGDIVSVDFGVVVDGFYGDAAVTLPVGRISEEAVRLCRVTQEALDRAIAQAVVGNRLSDISHAVQAHVEPFGFSVVREFVGHGIGRNLHESPQIPNFGPPGRGVKLKPGMVFAIEPMINQGVPDIRILEDRWTAVTADGKLSAHFEHTVAVTENGPDVLSRLA